MKKVLIALVALGIFTQAFAGSESCREQLEDKLLLKNVVAGTVTGVSALPVVSILIGAGAAAGPAILPVAIGTGLVGGTYWLISTRRPKRLIRLIDQANSCKGSLVSKAYKAYEKQHKDDNQRLTKSEFCSEIVAGNKDGSLCPSGMTPTVNTVGRYYIN